MFIPPCVEGRGRACLRANLACHFTVGCRCFVPDRSKTGFESHFVWQVRGRQSHQPHPLSKAPSLLFDPLTFGPLAKHADSPRETDSTVTSEPFPTVASESTDGCSKQFQSFAFNLIGLRIDAFSDCLVLRTTVAWLTPSLLMEQLKVVGFGR